MHLYEFSCNNCDLIMQIQLSKPLNKGMICVCESNLMLSFHTEIDEAVFPAEENYEEMDVQLSTMSNNINN